MSNPAPAMSIRCPFFKRERREYDERRQDGLYCECCRFRYPDDKFRRDLIYGLCYNASDTGWVTCMIYKMMTEYYERYERNLTAGSDPPVRR